MRALGGLVGVVFGLLLAGGGLAIFSETGLPMWQDWYAMQSWQRAAAKLLSVTGRDNETRASDRYAVDGVTHRGDRVYVAVFKDNIGSYHSNVYDRLDRQRRADEPVSIWMNPPAHSKAIIDRNLRWGLFAL
jgi:hypothetical protein